MSIVTDALNRLQSERAPKITTSSSESASPVSSVLSPTRHKPVATSTPVIRQILQGLALVMVLGVIGLGAYLWGLTMVPTVPEMPPAPYVDSMEGSASPLTETGEEVGQTQVALSSTSDGSDAGTASPASGTVQGQSAAPDRETALNTPTVSQSPKTGLATKQARVVPKAVNAPRVRQSPAPPTASSPAKKPGEEGAVKRSTTTAPAQALTKQDIPAKSSPLVPSGRTVLERRLSLVKQLINRKRYEQAMTLLQPLFVDPPVEWEPWFWRGTAYLGMGQLAKAEESFVEGLARDSTIPFLWVQRALVSQQRGHFVAAIESLRQAELLAPELPEVQLNLAYSLETQGNTQLAVGHYHNFLNLTEGKPAYHPARRKVLDRVIRLEEA